MKSRHRSTANCRATATIAFLRAAALRVDPVHFHPLAPLIPVLRLHHKIVHSHRLEFAVQVEAEGPRLITSVHLTG
ncbi:MAG: hypothetical protein ACR2RV_01365, partial [Verrucomicrobiales bacterium]